MKQILLSGFTRRLFSVCVTACIALTVPLTVYAQKTNLKLHNATVQQAILALRQQGYSISVKANDVNMDALVSIDVTNEDVQNVVDKIFSGQDVKCTINGKSIIVTKSTHNHPQVATSRNVRVSGHVKDASGQPLLGVTVFIEGTTSGATTDASGVYYINARQSDMLVFSYLGYSEHKEPVGSRSSIDVTMTEQTTSMDEVVVVGYGTQSRRSLTTAISKIDGSTLFDAPVSSVGEALKGKVSGLRVATNNTVSGETPRFLIRGGSSVNLSNDPIVIVDGVTRDMNDINPNDIESIEVLKDAASAGIYGARASNGVILVTTKKGSSNKAPEIVLDAQIGWSSPARKWNLMNSREFISFVRPAAAEGPNATAILTGANAAGTGNTLSNSTYTTRYLDYGQPVPAGYQWMYDPLDANKVIIFTDNDYQSDWFANALWHKEYVGVNGGTKNMKYAASVSYLGDDGVIAMSIFSHLI